MADDFDRIHSDGMAASDSSDADELDLSPKKRDDVKRGSKLIPAALLSVIAIGVAVLLFQGLSGASLFIRDADEAVTNRDELADRRFQLLGSPIAVSDEEFDLDGSIAVRFSIACDGTAVDVVHRGNVAESFQLGVPVVLEGNWESSAAIAEPWEQGANDGFYFESDRMLVKHDNEYREDRIEEASACGEDVPDAPDGTSASAAAEEN